MLKPLADRVIVEPYKEESPSGIIIPDSVGKDRPEKGKVVAVGPDKKINLTKGDIVYFTKYAPTELQVDGKDVLILNYSDILAKE